MNLPDKQKSLISELFEITSIADAPQGNVVSEIPVEDITSRAQIRTVFSDIEELAESLKAQGQLTPINVSRSTTDPSKFVIEQGERRWRAAKLAGLPTIKCIIVDEPKDQVDRTILQLTENLQRDDMRPHEIAQSFRKLNNAGLTNADIARRLGWSRQRVQVYANLINMHPRAEALAKEGKIADATTLQLVSRIYKAVGEDAGDKRLSQYKDEQGDVNLSRKEALRILSEVDPKHETSKNRKLSASPARKAKSSEDADDKEPNSVDATPSDGAEESTSQLSTPEGRITADSITMTVMVRSNDIYGKTLEREGRLLLEKRAKEIDHVRIRFADGTEDDVPCRSVTILSVEAS